MAPRATITEKRSDLIATFNILRDELTPPHKREVLANMNGAQQQAAAQVGDVQAYAALVQASLNLDRVISANDRTAMIAAAMIVGSGGVSRPIIEEGEL